jgi:tetratricopeptide (TPR) repeat protein
MASPDNYPAPVAGRSAHRLPRDDAGQSALVGRTRPAVARKATSEPPVEGRLRAMQASAGNAAVGRFLQREAANGADGTTDGAAHSILRLGDRGDEVRVLQEALNRVGAATRPLAIDGIFGPLTRGAVWRFQATHPPLSRDGDAGPETWSALASAPAKDAGEPGTGAQGTGESAPEAHPYEVGKEHYAAGRYAQAYDEFSKAWEADGDPAYLFNRAHALRLVGGRRAEAIALYEQFLAVAKPGEHTERATRLIEELRGPGSSGDKARDDAAVMDLFKKGQELYMAGDYARAYDEFSKAHEITGDPALLWNRAQALRLLGGRRSETIALYEQVLVAQGIPEDNKVAARLEIVELRGPGRSKDDAKDTTAIDALFKKGQELYQDEQYARAYDEFTKAYEVSGQAEMLWNRAQAMRLAGGRRAEAVALYEQVLTSNVPEEKKISARAHIADLKPRERVAEEPARR